MSGWRYRSQSIARPNDAHSDWDWNPRDVIAADALAGLMAGWTPPTGDTAQDRNTRQSEARALAKAAYAAAAEFTREKHRVDDLIKADIEARVAELANHSSHRLYGVYHSGTDNEKRDRIWGQWENALWSTEVWVEQNGSVVYHHEQNGLPPTSYPPASDSE